MTNNSPTPTAAAIDGLLAALEDAVLGYEYASRKITVQVSDCLPLNDPEMRRRTAEAFKLQAALPERAALDSARRQVRTFLESAATRESAPPPDGSERAAELCLACGGTREQHDDPDSFEAPAVASVPEKTGRVLVQEVWACVPKDPDSGTALDIRFAFGKTHAKEIAKRDRGMRATRIRVVELPAEVTPNAD